MLRVTDLKSGYGALQVVWGSSFYVAEGEFVSLVPALLEIPLTFK